MKLCLFTYLCRLYRNLHLGTIHLAHGLLTLEAPISTYKFSKLISIHFFKE